MLKDLLSFLARLAVETELLRLFDFDDLIQEFAETKSRKKCFNLILLQYYRY